MIKREFKQKCIELRKQDFTIAEMVKILNRPKTSIYFHIKNIPKTDILLAKIKEENNACLNRIRPNLKGISWKGRHCKEFEKWTPGLINLVAHSVFDGEIHKAGVNYNNSSNVLLENFKTKMKSIYDYEPSVYKTSVDVVRICYFSSELRDLFIKKSNELMHSILFEDIERQRAFLTAFFNDEGSMDFRGKKRQVRGYQHNNEILFLVQKLLDNFNIESKVSTRFHEIIISRRGNLEKFAKEINFSTGLKVNGSRSNSVWKKDLEKREILRMALASYL